MEIKSVGIIGAGVVGSSWATFYAGKGFIVKMYDIDPALCRKGLHRAVSIVEDLHIQGLLSEKDAQKAADSMTAANDLEKAVDGVQLVQESVTENYEVKQQVFKALDAQAPAEVILASSSSSLLMTKIQKVTRHPGRCLVAHPFNPPHLIPLVELVPGERTDRQTISKMKSFFESLGKVPVVLKKEAPGHIANRLALALWREAIDIVLKGVASVEDVDKAVFAGPGLRWALMGQHLIYHLAGGEEGMEHFIDHLGPPIEVLWQNLATWTTLPSETKNVLVEGVKEEMIGQSIAEVNQWRDEKLIKLLKVIYE